MKVLDLIDKYYPQDNELKHILNVHSGRWLIKLYGSPENIRN